jgi:1,6-anhydro-N-acetylmuramate kinase
VKTGSPAAPGNLAEIAEIAERPSKLSSRPNNRLPTKYVHESHGGFTAVCNWTLSSSTMVCLSVIGLNCGTSIDGKCVSRKRTQLIPTAVDVVHVDIETLGSTTPDIMVRMQSYYEYPVPNLLRKRILHLCRLGADTTLEEICDLNFELGEMFAAAIRASGVDLDKIDIVASHGSTLWHSPESVNKGGGELSSRISNGPVSH